MHPTLQKLERRPAASAEAIRKLAEFAGTTLPADYVAFLQETDGASGWVHEELFLELCSVDDAISKTLATREQRPPNQLLFFGGDGSREMLCLDLAAVPAEVLLLDVTFESAADSPWRIPGFAALLDHLETRSLFDDPE